MKHHGLWMIICCAIPLLLIFLAPLLGLAGAMYVFIFLVLCFGLHLFMMKGLHGKHNNDDGGKETGHGAH